MVQRFQHFTRIRKEGLFRNNLLVLGDLAHARGVLPGEPFADFRLPLAQGLARLVPCALVADVEVEAAALVVGLDEVAAEFADRRDDGFGYFELVEFGGCCVEFLYRYFCPCKNDLSVVVAMEQ